MSSRARRLLPDFRKHLDTVGAWPLGDDFETKARELCGKHKSGTLGCLKRGEPVAEKYCMVLVKMRWEERQGALRDAIANFMRKQGLPELDRLDDFEILNAVCDNLGNEHDWFLSGIDALGQVLNVRRHVSRFGRPCQNTKEVEDAVRWMYIESGRLARNEPLLPPADAIAADEVLFKITLPEFQRRAISWWKRDHRTIVLAIGEKHPVSMSIMLPLKEQVWRTVRSGGLASQDSKQNDLEVPSSYIVVEGLAPRPAEEGGEPVGYTRAALLVAAAQFAALANCTFPLQSDLHSLSYAPNALMKSRLVAQGYTPVGTQMHKLGMDLYERIVSCQSAHRSNLDTFQAVMLAMLKESLPLMV